VNVEIINEVPPPPSQKRKKTIYSTDQHLILHSTETMEQTGQGHPALVPRAREDFVPREIVATKIKKVHTACLACKHAKRKVSPSRKLYHEPIETASEVFEDFSVYITLIGKASPNRLLILKNDIF
jgi:hypothetical protein